MTLAAAMSVPSLLLLERAPAILSSQENLEEVALAAELAEDGRPAGACGRGWRRWMTPSATVLPLLFVGVYR